MSTDIEQAKLLIRAYSEDLDKASAEQSASILKKYADTDYQWRGMHPFNEIKTAEKVAEHFWRPLKSSLTSLVRRPDIFFASKNEIDDFSTSSAYARIRSFACYIYVDLNKGNFSEEKKLNLPNYTCE